MTYVSHLMRRASALALLLSALSAQAAGLPDTGITACYNDTVTDGYPATDSVNSIARDGGSHPRQDCRFGRDPAMEAAAPKVGAGPKGFDYTKIANDGSALDATVALGPNPTDWACTQDNITGLMWEVKTNSGLRSQTYTYTWYNSVTTTNGGNAGTVGAGSTCATAGRCDTEQFVVDVNALTGANRLCAATDWRLPTLRELLTLALLDDTNLTSIDAGYFPYTMRSFYWTASSSVPFPTNAWLVDFFGGSSLTSQKSGYNYVRLVRGGQF